MIFGESMISGESMIFGDPMVFGESIISICHTKTILRNTLKVSNPSRVLLYRFVCIYLSNIWFGVCVESKRILGG